MSGFEIVGVIASAILVFPVISKAMGKVLPGQRCKALEKSVDKMLIMWNDLESKEYLRPARLASIAEQIEAFDKARDNFHNSRKVLKHNALIVISNAMHHAAADLKKSIQSSSAIASAQRAKCLALHQEYMNENGKCSRCLSRTATPSGPAPGSSAPSPNPQSNSPQPAVFIYNTINYFQQNFAVTIVQVGEPDHQHTASASPHAGQAAFEESEHSQLLLRSR